MKKKNFVLMVVIIILIAILGIWGCIKFDGGNPGNNTSPVKPSKVIVPKFQTIYQLQDVCKSNSDENCKHKDAIYYRIDDFNNNPDLEPVLQKINSYYMNRKNDITNIPMDNLECETVANTYKYRYHDRAFIYYYVDDKMAIVTQYMETFDLCSNKQIKPLFEVYYYDVEWQKFTDEDGILKIINKKRSEIENKLIPELINKDLVKDKKEFTKLVNEKQISYKLYIDMVGNLVAGYSDNRDESYTSVFLYSGRELGLHE